MRYFSRCLGILTAGALVMTAVPTQADSRRRIGIKVHGDESPLSRSIAGAELGAAEAWIYGNSAIIVRVFPEPIDFRVEDAPPGVLPWRPAWISGWAFVQYLSKAEA